MVIRLFHHLRHLLPVLGWPAPTAHSLRQDAFAGITVGLMLVPQAVAYAVLAGMPLETGLYASIAPLIVAALLASSPRLGLGPSALTALMVSSALMPMAIAGSADWVLLAIWLALLAGLTQLLMGLLRLEWLLNVITSPILNGFTQAAALLIMASQAPALTGVSWAQWSSVARLEDFWQLWLNIDTGALQYGLAGIVAFTLARRLGPRIPSAIAILAFGALVSWLTGYGSRGGAVIGDLHVHLKGLQWPLWIGWPLLGQLLVPALVIALMSFVEVAASAKKEHERAGTNWMPYQDWIAQGMAKIASGLSGGFATSASFSRSAVNLYAGAVSGWSAIFTALFVLAVSLWFTPLLRHVPLALLGALVITAVSNFIAPSWFRKLWAFSRAETLVALLTFTVTLLASPRIYWGVLAGLLANLALFMYQRLHPRIIEVGVFPADGRLRDRHLWNLPPISEKVLSLRMDAPLDFATANALEQRVIQALEERPAISSVCLVASAMASVDATGMETLQRIRDRLVQQGGVLFISGMKLPMELKLRDGRFLNHPEHVRLLQTDAETVQALRNF